MKRALAVWSNWTHENWWVLAILTAWACLAIGALGCGVPRTGDAPPVGSEQEVAWWGFCPNRFQCAGWKPYLRLDQDLSGPIYWLIGADGRACEVDGMVTAKLKRWDKWACAWRQARP